MIQSISQKSEQSDHYQGKQVKQRKKWQLEETRKYYEFLQKYKSVLQQSQKKQKQRIYNRMSDYVGTRSTHQCRSHHQKVMKRHQSIERFMEAFVIKMELIRNNNKLQKPRQQIKKSSISLNQPIQQGQNGWKTIKQAQSKLDYNQKIKKKSQLQSQCRKEHNQSYLQGRQKSNSQMFKTFQDPYVNSIDFPQNRFDMNFLNYQKAQKDFFEGSKIHKTYMLNQDKSSSHIQKNSFLGMREHQRSQEVHLKSLNQTDKKISQKSSLQNFSKSNLLKIASKVTHVNIPYEQVDLPRQNLIRVSSQVCEPLPKDPQSLTKNASYICSSIIQKQNLEMITPLVNQRIVEFTPKQIKINYKQEEFYKMWIECNKVQEVSENEKGSFDCRQIEQKENREIPVYMIPREKQFSKSPQPYYQSTFIRDQKLFSQLQNCQKPKSLFQNVPPLKDYYNLNSVTKKLIPKCLDLQTFFGTRKLIETKTHKILQKTAHKDNYKSDFNHKQQNYLIDEHQQHQHLQKLNFFRPNQFLSIYGKSQSFAPQKRQCFSSNRFLYGSSFDYQKDKRFQGQKFTQSYPQVNNYSKISKQNN